jgi:hypothetical protein
MGIYTYQNNRRQADMKKINWIEDLKASGNFKLSQYGLNHTTYWAYNDSLEAENETLDFGDVIWEQDIEEIIAFCKDNGFKEITISSTFSSLITILAKFEELGCKMDGLTKVNKRFKESNGEREQIPALRMIIK